MLPLSITANAIAPGWMKAGGMDFVHNNDFLPSGKDNHDGSLQEYAPPRQPR